jgi:hypothetical protein
MTSAIPTVRISSPMWPKACTFLRRKRSHTIPTTAATTGATISATQKFPVRDSTW